MKNAGERRGTNAKQLTELGKRRKTMKKGETTAKRAMQVKIRA